MPNETVFDIIVVGGGVAGAATTEALARQGVRVLLIEQFEPGHERGSSHGDGRIIRLAYPEAIYLELVQLAYAGWRDLSQRAGEPLIEITGGLDIGTVDSPDLAALEANWQQFEIPYERLSPAECHDRFPHFRLDVDERALFQADGGVVYATPGVKAMWRLARAAGAETITGERVTRLHPQGDAVRVEGASGRTWSAGRVVVCAGSWAGKLLAGVGLHLPLEPIQTQVAYFAPLNRIDHTTKGMPVFIDHHGDCYGLPQIVVPGVKLGLRRHEGLLVDPDRRLPFDDTYLSRLSVYARRRLPHVDPTPIEPVSCLYTCTPDLDFIFDHHPEYPNIVFGAGFSGHGFKFGPALGQVLAAIATDQTPPVSLAAFAGDRF